LEKDQQLKFIVKKSLLGVPKLKQDSNRGGRIAGNARKELDKEIGRPVVSKKNYLQNKKQIK